MRKKGRRLSQVDRQGCALILSSQSPDKVRSGLMFISRDVDVLHALRAELSSPLLVVVPVGMWAKASISPLSELPREAGEAQPVGEADRPHIHRLSS